MTSLCMIPLDEWILKCMDPGLLVQPLPLRQRVPGALPVYKPPGAFPSTILHQPDSDSQLENQPLYYVVNFMCIHRELFSGTC